MKRQNWKTGYMYYDKKKFHIKLKATCSFAWHISHRIGGGRERSWRPTGADRGSLVFCCLFLAVFGLRSSMVVVFSIAACHVCICINIHVCV